MLSINLSGKFKLKLPFVALGHVTYRIIAIREFADLYLRGVDVYNQYYLGYGVENGNLVNGAPFKFEDEAKNNVTIVTLEGNDDTIIYVPSSFIEDYPDKTDVVYSRLILSADLGVLPDNVPVDSILDDVKELIESRFGVTTSVNVVKAFTPRQPTVAEHTVLEASRVGAISSATNNYSENIKLKAALAKANESVRVLTDILVENGYL